MPVTSKKREAGVAPPPTPLDYQEQAALDRAADALARFGPGSPKTLAAVVIAEWILARTSLATSPRLHAELLFNLGDARLRGYVEAALPRIAATLSEVANIPDDAPVFSLDKAQIVDLFMAGIEGAREAAVAANESLGFPFSDDVPFG